MNLNFVDRNPTNVDGCFWIAKMEISLSETIVFGVDNLGNPKLYLYSHILRSMQATDLAYRLHSWVDIDPINIDAKIGEVSISSSNKKSTIFTRYRLFEIEDGLELIETSHVGYSKIVGTINALETNLLKARMQSFSKKVKEEIKGEENEIIGY
jgi:hypothetical protein